MRPLIGVTTSEVRQGAQVSPTPEGEPVATEMALGMSYLKAIEAAGAVPVVIPPLPLDAIDGLVERFAGVCLSGGPDIHPSGYGQQAHPKLGPTWPELDRFELALAGEADRRRLPILAICRGAQALNVARGGSLLQHLPERTGSARHRQKQPGEEATHRVRIDRAGALYPLVGAEELDVNSFHHQAVERLGKGLRPIAWSEDGVVEAVEAVDRAFVLGVQWHVELLIDRPEHAAIFTAFVDAARGRGPAVAPVRAA